MSLQDAAGGECFTRVFEFLSEFMVLMSHGTHFKFVELYEFACSGQCDSRFNELWVNYFKFP